MYICQLKLTVKKPSVFNLIAKPILWQILEKK